MNAQQPAHAPSQLLLARSTTWGVGSSAQREQLNLFGAQRAPASKRPNAAQRIGLERGLAETVTNVLPGDTWRDRGIVSGAREWSGMLSACGFVRVRRLRDADGSPHYQASVLSFDNDGFGRVAHAFGGEAATFLFLRRELAGRANVVMLGAEAKLVARSLPSGSRIVERRSALSLRVMEVGLVGAIRDESQRLAAQLRETPSHADALGRRWLADQAKSELLSLAALGPCRPTFH